MRTDGATVVLYTCTFTSQIATTTLAALHAFAAERGWTIQHEAYDMAPLHVPARLRTGWRSAAHLLDTGEVAGLVVPAEYEIARNPREQGALRQWLLSVPAFAAYPYAGRQTPLDDQLALPGAPVDRQWRRSYALTPASLRRLRSDARMFLTVLGWQGDVPTALEVLSRLAHNAVVHAQPVPGIGLEAEMTVRLAITEDNALLIDVEDPRPEFPGSEAAIAGETGSGLMYVRALDATVTWFLSEDACSKTVRAVLLGEVST
ncbi:hypothetical protein [Streptomyces sp. NPDC101455]|uniref:hypothetical protein n=1 Tax=Streptomyces sp. NPDC101455 TaxID=3366142 RepID=UPI003820C25E